MNVRRDYTRKIKVHMTFMDDEVNDVDQITFDNEFDTIEEANEFQKHVQELFEKYGVPAVGTSTPVIFE